MLNMNTHLLHALPGEQARCRELVRKYVAIGSAGAWLDRVVGVCPAPETAAASASIVGCW